MGHAGRPRLHDAFCLDAQSRSVRLSVTERRHSHSNTYTDVNTYRDTNSNSHSDSNCNSNPNAQADADPKACSYAEAASYAATAAIARRLQRLILTFSDDEPLNEADRLCLLC